MANGEREKDAGETVSWDLSGFPPAAAGNAGITVKAVGTDKLRDIGRILVKTWGGFITRPEETEQYLAADVAAGRTQPFIAYLGDAPVGCVCARANDETRIGRLDGGVHVLPAYRRRGVGTALLRAALAWLKDKGMTSARVTPWNPEGEDAVARARAFYLACGGKLT